MKILQVIHGYPPQYMAGSEVYTWNLSRHLTGSHQVSVFTRIENPYAAPYRTTDSLEDGVFVRRLNKPGRDYTFRDKYLDHRVDEAFRAMLRKTKPDVVHFGHLSHLSTQLPAIARAEFGIPTVLTIHDFWMYCFRGQLVRPDGGLCDGPSVAACLDCSRHFFKEWIDQGQVEARLRHIRDVVEHLDVCLAPSRTVATFFRNQGVPEQKVIFSPYGFDVNRITPRKTPRVAGPLRFGFLGRVIPCKGIHVLLEAFHATQGRATLDVWGDASSDRRWLDALCGNDPRVTFRGGYHNGQIQEALDDMDLLVAPSLWLENSPLVIQEALLAELPVITSDAGGMAELVQDGRNGFLFPLGDVGALRGLLQRVMDDPGRLGALKPDRGSVRTIADDAEACVAVYQGLAGTRRTPALPMCPAPRRVTFVTNPGLCNLHCPMCDTHSRYASADPKELPLLDFDVVERVVLELAQRGLQEILPSTMGEPLLYPDFRRLLELAARTGVKVNLTTNGTFPGRGGVDAWTAALLPVVSDVKFSVNAIEPAVAERVMPGAGARLQLQNIRRYLELKCRRETETGQTSTATVQATFMESTLEELPRLLRWAIANGLDRFKGHQLWVTWPQMEAESLRRSHEAAARWNRMVDVLREIAEHETAPNGKRIRLENVEPIRLDSEPRDGTATRCPFLGREAWIEADGTFQVCCCPRGERKAFGEFGSVLDAPFMDLWTSLRYRDFVEGWGRHPNCLKCNMRRPVEEDAND
jgi:glycosyltransferase involved in cell wall biosynthesis/MoaA/NifB/PqqE/SkfB family radical SAM enzyme